MKNLVIILSLTIGIVSSCSTSSENTASNIKTITEYQFGAKEENGEIVKDNNGGYNGIVKLTNHDENGKEKEVIRYHKTGDIISKYINIYDSEGNKVEVRSYDKDDNLISTTKLSIDAKGNNFESLIIDADDNVTRRTLNTFDEKGNIIMYVNYNAEEIETQKVENKYDDSGNQIEVLVADKGRLLSISKNTFDEHQNITSSQFEIEDGSLSPMYTFKNSYNDNNFMIKSVSFVAEEAMTITEREVVYYAD